jgi:archaellum component FlaC
MEDKSVVELVKHVSNPIDSEKLVKIEVEFQHIKEDIKDLQQQKKEIPKELEAKKDKKAAKIFQTIGAFCGISGLIITLLKLCLEYIFKHKN